MSTIFEIRDAYLETLTDAEKALASILEKEATRVAIRNASLDLAKKQEAKRLENRQAALDLAERQEAKRLEIRAAVLDLAAKQEAKRLAETAVKVAKLRAKIEDYQNRIRATI